MLLRRISPEPGRLIRARARVSTNDCKTPKALHGTSRRLTRRSRSKRKSRVADPVVRAVLLQVVLQPQVVLLRAAAALVVAVVAAEWAAGRERSTWTALKHPERWGAVSSYERRRCPVTARHSNWFRR